MVSRRTRLDRRVPLPRGRTFQAPGTGSQRYSSSVRPSSRGRSWCSSGTRAGRGGAGSIAGSVVVVMRATLPALSGQILSAIGGTLPMCPIPPNACCGCSGCSSSGPCGPGPSWPTASASRPKRASRRRSAPGAGLPGQRHPGRGRRIPARCGTRCRRCCSTTRRRSRRRCRCGSRPAARWPGPARPPYAPWPSSTRCCPPRLRAEVRAVHDAIVTLEGGRVEVDADALLVLARAARDPSGSS